jgi:hypothetical protein
MFLSKSQYCECKNCPKILWLYHHKPELLEDTDSLENSEKINADDRLNVGIKVGNVARDYFEDYSLIPYKDNINEMVDETIKLIENKTKIIAEATFIYDNNLCKIDILRKNKKNYDIVEVKSATRMKEEYYDDCAFQYYVVTSFGLSVKRVYVMYLNNNYVKHGELDLKQLFYLEDCTYRVISMQNDIENTINQLKKTALSKKEPIIDIGPHCGCAFYNYCWRDIPKPNVFDVANMRSNKKWDLFTKGIVSFEQLLENNCLNDNQNLQVEYELKKTPPRINKKAIKAFLKTLSFPLYFLDFETFQQAIPEFDGISPYKQIPFQYSLHILSNSRGKLDHKEFLAKEGTDPRRLLAESLCRDIPQNVCILAYNMNFEKGVIKGMAEIFPDLSENLLNIHKNINDLMIPFQLKDYYCREMEGSYSIKYVLPALFPDNSDLDYNLLPGIHNGGDAMSAFSELVYHTPEEIQSIRNALLKYCCLDTLAMVKIYEKLSSIINQSRKNGA